MAGYADLHLVIDPDVKRAAKEKSENLSRDVEHFLQEKYGRMGEEEQRTDPLPFSDLRYNLAEAVAFIVHENLQNMDLHAVATNLKNAGIYSRHGDALNAVRNLVARDDVPFSREGSTLVFDKFSCPCGANLFASNLEGGDCPGCGREFIQINMEEWNR